jgi:tetratricopeptide (TPR) repeat protein
MTMMIHRHVALSSLALLLLLPSAASAQQTTCKPPNDRQINANKSGAKAMEGGDMESAAKIFKKSLDDDGDLNITFLNLGRAYQKLGRCREAADTYQRALETNRCVPAPSPEKVRELTAQYRYELEATCPGEITLSCSPPEMMIQIGDRPERACSSFEGPVSLDPGRYQITATLQGQTVRQDVEVRPIQTTPVALSLAVVGPPPEDKLVKKDDEVTPPIEVKPVVAQPVDSSATWGWVQVGAGVAVIVASVILDNVPDSANNYKFDGADLAPVGGYLVGGFLLVNGLRMAF